MPRTASGLHFVENLNSRRNRMAQWRHRADSEAAKLQRELEKLDRHLRVCFVDPEAANNRIRDKAPGIRPGRWHVVRRNPGHVDSWFPLTGPNGEYRDPGMDVIDAMKALDLWRPGALKELRDREARAALTRERQVDLEREQHRDDIAADHRAALRTHSMAGTEKSFARKRRGEGLRKPEKKLIVPGE